MSSSDVISCDVRPAASSHRSSSTLFAHTSVKMRCTLEFYRFRVILRLQSLRTLDSLPVTSEMKVKARNLLGEAVVDGLGVTPN